jgi:sugar (pentulose or hexulose) kinase
MHVCSGVPGRWLRVFPSMSGTDGIDWFQQISGIDDPAEISHRASEVAPGADGLLLLPYLSPAGERAPFVDPHARATLHGLSLEHGSEHLARAWLEGLTFVIRHCVEASPVAPRELRVSGGGAASAEWCQIIADVLGVPVITSRDEEVGAKGAVLTGRSALGEDSLSDLASALFRPRRTFDPRDDVHARYGELFGAWCALRDHVRVAARERVTA